MEDILILKPFNDDENNNNINANNDGDDHFNDCYKFLHGKKNRGALGGALYDMAIEFKCIFRFYKNDKNVDYTIVDININTLILIERTHIFRKMRF